MALVTRTLVGAELQVAQFHKLPYNLRPNTTLNQKFDIQADQTFPAGTYPAARYLTIGNRGHRFAADADGEVYPQSRKHRARDMAAFRHMPFVCRQEDDDLTPEQRSRYGLRRIEVHGGIRYFVYYALRLDFTNVQTQLINTEVDEGVSNDVAFNFVNGDLNPEPPEVVPNQSLPTLQDGDYLSVRCVTTIQFTPAEVQEIIAACGIVFSNENVAAVSELCITSGVDRLVGVEEFGGGTVQFNEIIGAQIVTHVTTYNYLPASNDGAKFTFDIGITEALLTEVGQGGAIGSLS